MFYIKNGFKGKILNKVRIFFSNLEPESKSIINKKIEIGLSVMKFMGWGTLPFDRKLKVLQESAWI